MQKGIAWLLITACVAMVSGCTVISRHTAPVDGGKKTTVGLIGVSTIDNGYPMIPFYSAYEQGK